MKLLHTSDLHLGSRWGGAVSRAEDEARVLDEILAIADHRDVDVILVTGDIFADRAESVVAREAKRFLDALRPHLQQGRVVVLLRGNHDSLPLFTLLTTLIADMGGADWPLVVVDLPGVYPIPGRSLQIVALPYVGLEWLARGEDAADRGPEERAVGLAGLLAKSLQQLYLQAAPDLPAIFAAHIQIRGAQLTADQEIESGYRELWLDKRDLPQFTSYNALGHIHLGQEVPGVGKPTWYAGAPDRMNLGECSYEPKVIFVDLPVTPGGVASVELISLVSCTPWISEALVGKEAIDAFCKECETSDWPCSPIGRITLSGIPVAQRTIVEAHLRQLAPRIELIWTIEGTPALTHGNNGFDPHDVPSVVADFLRRSYIDKPDHLARLQAAFLELWSEEVAS